MNGIFTIDTRYVRPHMDASHLILDGGRAAFVDTGTNDSVPRLLAALQATLSFLEAAAAPAVLT